MHVPTHRAIGTRLKEKLSGLEAVGGGVESGFRASGAGRAVAGAVRPSSECATSCSSCEWRARFAATTTAFDARFGGADGAGASAWTLAASAATGGAARGSGGRATTGGAIEVEGKENDTADTARAATGGGMELAITGRAFVAMMVGVAMPPSGVSICMAS